MLEKSWLETVILEKEKACRVVKCLEMTEEPLALKNKNFTSDVSRIKMTVELGSGKSAAMSFVAKKIPNAEGMREFYNEYRVMEQEVAGYENLSRMERLMMSREDRTENLWGQLKGRTDSVLIFEDLTAKGYNPYPTEYWLREEHSKYILRELARYHAMGIALVETNMVDTRSFKSAYFFYKSAQEKFYKIGIKSFQDGVKTWGQEWSESVNQLDQIVDHFDQVVQMLDRINRTTMNVMSHGDCWKGNMLFKFDVLGQILSMKFVDFQRMSYCSYVYDLIIFLHSSVNPEILWNLQYGLLEAYRESLLANMNFYNLDSTKAPTLQEMKDTLEFLQPVMIILMTVHWPAISNESEMNVTDAYDKNKTMLRPEMYASQECKLILGQHLKGMLGKKFLWE